MGDGGSKFCFLRVAALWQQTAVHVKSIIVGETVDVSAAGIERPVAVNFVWTETAQRNFFNKTGRPAEPFRTDEPVK